MNNNKLEALFMEKYVNMASIRQKQVSETVKRHFSRLLQEEGATIYGAQPLVTVTSVDVSPDLAQAVIYVSIYNVENKEEILDILHHNYGLLRSGLGNRLKRHVRRIPVLDIRLDDMLDEMVRLNQIFNKLEKDKTSDQQE